MVHLTLLLLVLCAGVTASSVVDLQKRLLGGQPCPQNERRYHVLLLQVAPDGSGKSCGGSLLNKWWILTAAHCATQPGETMVAYLGGHPNQAQKRRVVITETPRIFTDKDINQNDRSHDLMLLKLPSRETRIRPVNLPNCGRKPQINQFVQIAGYGRRPGGQSPDFSTLHCANIQVIDCDMVRTLVPVTAPNRVYQHWFCGRSAGVETCRGDSGSGIVVNNMIYGVLSFENRSQFECMRAAGFMDVCNPDYLRWIQDTIRPATSNGAQKLLQSCFRGFNCFKGVDLFEKKNL